MSSSSAKVYLQLLSPALIIRDVGGLIKGFSKAKAVALLTYTGSPTDQTEWRKRPAEQRQNLSVVYPSILESRVV